MRFLLLFMVYVRQHVNMINLIKYITWNKLLVCSIPVKKVLHGFFNSHMKCSKYRNSKCILTQKLQKNFLCWCLIAGDGQWVSERSLSAYADDSVVQGVLESQVNRAENALQAQKKLSPLMATWMPQPGRDSPNWVNLNCVKWRHSVEFVIFISQFVHLYVGFLVRIGFGVKNYLFSAIILFIWLGFCFCFCPFTSLLAWIFRE